VHRLCTELLARVGRSESDLRAFSIGVPGRWRPSGHGHPSADHAGLGRLPDPGFFADLSSAAVLVDNDVNMMALASTATAETPSTSSTSR